MNGYGVRGMDIDRNGVVWSSLASGHLASFDRRKCKGPAQRSERHGQALSRRLDALPFSRPAIPERESVRAAWNRAITRGSISSTLSGSGRNVPIATGNLNDGLLALVDGRFVTLARAVSDGFLREMDGRPYRRCKRRLERQRPVGHHVHPRAFPHGRRERHPAESGEIPASSRPACALISLPVEHARRGDCSGASATHTRRMHLIKAAIFDVDGTLVDSNLLHVEAWRVAFSTTEKR